VRLLSRLKRLERRMLSKATAGIIPTFRVTDDERVAAVRALLERYDIPDPLPGLEGIAYMDAFGPLYQQAVHGQSDAMDNPA
jgi:hypothetical protein